MLRYLFRRPRTVRVPIDRSSVEVQQVKVKQQARPVVSQFIWTVIVTTVIIQGVKRWDPLGTYSKEDVLQEGLDRMKKSAQRGHGDKYGEHWEKQHSQIRGSTATPVPPNAVKSDAMRITVPIWIRKGMSRPYNESDPEWKEYVKFQLDSKRRENVKKQIGASFIHQINHHAFAKYELEVIKFDGRINMAVDFVPQIVTPPTYEVPCLWLSSSSISAGWRPLTAQTGSKMERVFRPIVLLEASTEAVKTFCHITYFVAKAKLQHALGREQSPEQKTIVAPPKLPSPKSNTVSVESPKSTKPVFPYLPSLANGDTMRKMHADVISSMPLSIALQYASAKFNVHRNFRQKEIMQKHTSGILQIRAHFACYGARGILRVEAHAHYLPSEDAWVGYVDIKEHHVVQDYVAWEHYNKNIRKRKQTAENTKTVPTSGESKPTQTPSAPPPNRDEEQSK